MKQLRFMRLIIFFDLPQKTKADNKKYRNFIKFLKNNGYIMMQYSVYSKLCLNSSTVLTQKKLLQNNSPTDGDVRYLVISEQQYQGIRDINESMTFQEKITNENRLLIIGGQNDI